MTTGPPAGAAPRVGGRWQAGRVELFTGGLEREGDYEGLELDDRDLTGHDAREARFVDCAFHHCVLDGVRMAPQLRQAGITLAGGKVDYLNLRDATVRELRIVGATIDDLDLAGTTARDVVVEASRVRRLDVARARLTHVDLRGADLARVDGLDGLAGATISEEQLAALAPLLAAHLGVVVR